MFSRGATLDDKVLPIELQELKIDRHDDIVPQMEFFAALNLFSKYISEA